LSHTSLPSAWVGRGAGALKVFGDAAAGPLLPDLGGSAARAHADAAVSRTKSEVRTLVAKNMMEIS
jgi:hypothetical protein